LTVFPGLGLLFKSERGGAGKGPFNKIGKKTELGGKHREGKEILTHGKIPGRRLVLRDR